MPYLSAFYLCTFDSWKSYLRSLTSLITYMYEHIFHMFNSDLFIHFCELLAQVCFGLGIWLQWTEKPTWTGVIGWRSQALWFTSKNKYRGQPDFPETKTGGSASLCHLYSPALHTKFPFSFFSEASFSIPQLYVPPGFGLPCHLVEPYYNMTFLFRYLSSSKCHGYLCLRFLGVSNQLARFH